MNRSSGKMPLTSNVPYSALCMAQALVPPRTTQRKCVCYCKSLGRVKIAIFVATILGLLIANAIAIVYRIKSVVIVEGSNIEIDEMDSLRGYYFQQAICRSGIQSLKYNLGDLE